MKSPKLFFVCRCILLFGSMLFLQNSFATVCFSPSPSRQAELELTTDIVSRTLTKDELSILGDMFMQLDGKWAGQADETVCKGKSDNVNPVQHRYTLDIDIEIYRKTELKFKAVLDSMESRKSRNEFLEIYLSSDKFRVNDEFAAGDVEIIKLTDNFVSFFKKIIIRTKSGGISVRELVQSISLTGKRLSMEFQVYSNGVLSSHTVWTADRKL